MPSLVIPNTIQCRLVWNLDGAEHAVNVLHFRNDNNVVVDQALANQVATAINTASSALHAGVAYRQRIANNFTLQKVTLRNIHAANQPEIENAVQPVFTGQDPGAILPVATALVVTLRTPLAGKSFRGRVFLPGFSAGSNTGLGTPSADVVTHAVIFVNAIDTNVQAATTLRLAVASRKLGVANYSTSRDADARWDTQRRRNVPGI